MLLQIHPDMKLSVIIVSLNVSSLSKMTIIMSSLTF